MSERRISFYSKKGKFALHTSTKELKDLLVAWLFVSLAFAIARTSGSESYDFFSTNFLISIAISALTVGVAFLLHELAHKIVAQKYHCWAEFRADLTMLVLGLLMSLLGIVFIAPGAVMIYGNIDYKQNGKISIAGPLTNIILALIMLPFLFTDITNTLIKDIVQYGFIINAWLALFNMIPLWNFDGAKIYQWNKKAYFTTVIVSAFLVFIGFIKIFGAK